MSSPVPAEVDPVLPDAVQGEKKILDPDVFPDKAEQGEVSLASPEAVASFNEAMKGGLKSITPYSPLGEDPVSSAEFSTMRETGRSSSSNPNQSNPSKSVPDHSPTFIGKVSVRSTNYMETIGQGDPTLNRAVCPYDPNGHQPEVKSVRITSASVVDADPALSEMGYLVLAFDCKNCGIVGTHAIDPARILWKAK